MEAATLIPRKKYGRKEGRKERRKRLRVFYTNSSFCHYLKKHLIKNMNYTRNFSMTIYSHRENRISKYNSLNLVVKACCEILSHHKIGLIWLITKCQNRFSVHCLI